MGRTPRLEIEYCTQCRWLLRAGWMAQELLTTFQEELGEVALMPGTGGVFEVRIDGTVQCFDRVPRLLIVPRDCCQCDGDFFEHPTLRVQHEREAQQTKIWN